jgi:beta-lactamase superfamily II metal-dependent hydrolase
MAATKSRTRAKSKAGTSHRGRSRTHRAAERQGVRVRMYRQGFGDCLLVELPADGGKPFRLLIDCGVLWATSDGAGRMRRVVENLIADTDGFIDVLVVTHEHWDHVSAFAQASDLFARPEDGDGKGKLSFGEVWLAWTEDPADRMAALLRNERRQRLKALVGLVDGLRTAGPLAALPLAGGLSNVLGFFALSATATADALDNAKSLGPHRYWRPSDPPWTSERIPKVRIYALGPPPDATLIRRLTAKGEVYQEFGGAALDEAFFAAVADQLGLDGGTDERQALFVPFDRTEWLPLNGDGLSAEVGQVRDAEEVAALKAFFEKRYWGAAEEGSPDQGWRRIDHDWLGTAAELALQLDTATNNTSLVLAIELVESRKVLLFAGDAQVGNWLSWHDLEWTLEDGTSVTGASLIERTSFYKVGHHGSHNATLKDKGLELMGTDGFVAFIPVDAETAAGRNWHRIPFAPLMEALTSRGHVVRSDVGAPEGATDDRFAKRLKQTDMYIEYTVPL